MPSYRLYTGVPIFKRLKEVSSKDAKWAFVPQHRFLATSVSGRETSMEEDGRHESSGLIPVATLQEASNRISGMYNNVIFSDDGVDEEDGHLCAEREVNCFLATPAEEMDSRGKVQLFIYILAHNNGKSNPDSSNEGSLISWPPTNPAQLRVREPSSPLISISRRDTADETQVDHSVSVSYSYTSVSSIALFPAFVVNLHTLSTLSALTRPHPSSSSIFRKVNLLVAVLEVDGPEAVTIKKGKDAGKEITVLKLIVSDESGAACKITAWREVAERWAGHTASDDEESRTGIHMSVDAVKKGDIVYLTSKSHHSGFSFSH